MKCEISINQRVCHRDPEVELITICDREEITRVYACYPCWNIVARSDLSGYHCNKHPDESHGVTLAEVIDMATGNKLPINTPTKAQEPTP